MDRHAVIAAPQPSRPASIRRHAGAADLHRAFIGDTLAERPRLTSRVETLEQTKEACMPLSTLTPAIATGSHRGVQPVQTFVQRELALGEPVVRTGRNRQAAVGIHDGGG